MVEGELEPIFHHMIVHHHHSWWWLIRALVLFWHVEVDVAQQSPPQSPARQLGLGHGGSSGIGIGRPVRLLGSAEHPRSPLRPDIGMLPQVEVIVENRSGSHHSVNILLPYLIGNGNLGSIPHGPHLGRLSFLGYFFPPQGPAPPRRKAQRL